MTRPGAHDRNRTGDLVLTKDVLYRLSYVGLDNFSNHPTTAGLERVMGIEPTSTAWKAEVLPLNYTRSVHRPALQCPAPPANSTVMVEGVGFEPTKA
jgi:hypothetical protein